jgi:hypothetical protein
MRPRLLISDSRGLKQEAPIHCSSPSHSQQPAAIPLLRTLRIRPIDCISLHTHSTTNLRKMNLIIRMPPTQSRSSLDHIAHVPQGSQTVHLGINFVIRADDVKGTLSQVVDEIGNGFVRCPCAFRFGKRSGGKGSVSPAWAVGMSV